MRRHGYAAGRFGVDGALHSFGGMAVATSGSGKRGFEAKAACDPRLGRVLENILGESPGDGDPSGCSFLLTCLVCGPTRHAAVVAEKCGR